MSSTHYQIIKWSFPAVALIVGLFWYKRKRADRADPGGISTSNVLETIDKIKASLSRENVNLSDSGITANDSYSSLHAQSIEEPISNCKEVSEKQKAKMSEEMMPLVSKMIPVFIPVPSSMKETEPWYEEVENLYNSELLYQNHPSTSDYQMVNENVDPNGYCYDATINSEMVQDVNVNNIDVEQNNAQLLSSSVDKQNEINHTSTDVNEKTEQTEQTEQIQNDPPEEENKNPTQALSERDSANYSPLSGVLEGSVTDEAGSEDSADSGKGGSIEGQMKEESMQYVYEFAIRNDLVGKLIGRHGSFLQNIRTKAGVNIVVKRHPMSINDKICAIQGSNDSISIALEIIRRKFPEKKYPDLTLLQIVPMAMIGEIIPFIPMIKELSLAEAINNDVSVCYVIKPNRFFVHMPTHPSHPMLRYLDTNMAEIYNNEITPTVEDITKGMVLAAPLEDGKWARVYVVDPDPRRKTNLVRLVDHGGYRTYPDSSLRQIRSDFLSLPFQAIEVFLANVRPKNGEWHPDSLNIMEEIVTERIGLARIVAYVDSHVYIDLFFNIGKHGIISFADELIAREYAEPVSWECLISSGNTGVSL